MKRLTESLATEMWVFLLIIDFVVYLNGMNLCPWGLEAPTGYWYINGISNSDGKYLLEEAMK